MRADDSCDHGLCALENTIKKMRTICVRRVLLYDDINSLNWNAQHQKFAADQRLIHSEIAEEGDGSLLKI